MKNVLEVYFNSVDASGNKLELVGEDLFLTLSADRRRRNIGQIRHHHIDKGKLMYVKHEDMKDVFRKTNAWSLFYYVVERVDYILIICDGIAYKLTSQQVKERGDFLYFKTSGYEKKIYVPLDKWWKEKV